MNDVLNNIYTRRSCRTFTDKEIDSAELELIAKAGLFAPNGCNKQQWHFAAVKNAELIKEMYQAVGKALSRDESYNFYAPTAVILVSSNRDNPHGPFDSACALENIFLAAHSLGIGSVWINQFNGICDRPEIRAVLDKAKVPSDHVVWGMAALGYPAHEHKTAVRNENDISYVD